MGYVYKITNTVNNKSYIGISVHEPEKGRIREHLSGKGNRIIANAVKKYGRDAFTYEILEADIFDEFLPDLEVTYIANFNTVAPHGYNLNSGGDHAIPSKETRQKISEANRNPSEETRRKMSEAKKGKYKGEKHPLFGKKHSKEARRKISEAQKGRKHSKETRQKISEAQKGKTISKEARQKMSETNKGRKHSEETRQKMSESLKGRKPSFLGKKHSKEARRKMSESLKGRKHSLETRRKWSETRKGKMVHPEYDSAHKYFLSLPSDMPLKEKRKHFYRKFPKVSQTTRKRWVRKWVSAKN